MFSEITNRVFRYTATDDKSILPTILLCTTLLWLHYVIKFKEEDYLILFFIDVSLPVLISELKLVKAQNCIFSLKQVSTQLMERSFGIVNVNVMLIFLALQWMS